MTAKDKPTLRENRNGENGPYIQEWWCDPPALGKLFDVTREEWAEDPETGLPLRKVHAVKLFSWQKK
jgi:hypothetical protein